MTIQKRIQNQHPFDLDDDPKEKDQESNDAGATVGLMNHFRNLFSQSDEQSRDLMLRGLFQVDQQDRKAEFDNAELRKKSVEDLYGSLSEIHQEQIRRYIILLLADQNNVIE